MSKRKKVTIHTNDGNSSTVYVDSEKEAAEYEEMTFKSKNIVYVETDDA